MVSPLGHSGSCGPEQVAAHWALLGRCESCSPWSPGALPWKSLSRLYCVLLQALTESQGGVGVCFHRATVSVSLEPWEPRPWQSQSLDFPDHYGPPQILPLPPVSLAGGIGLLFSVFLSPSKLVTNPRRTRVLSLQLPSLLL